MKRRKITVEVSEEVFALLVAIAQTGLSRPTAETVAEEMLRRGLDSVTDGGIISRIIRRRVLPEDCQ